MREWKVNFSQSLGLPLVADARLVPTDYLNDHIWQLTCGAGDPPALAIQTSFGLRARSFRIFPRFVEDERDIVNPAEFAATPVVKKVYPNYISVAFSPLWGIEVLAEYWASSSHAIAGRFTIMNQGEQHRTFRLELAAQLSPTTGQRMALAEFQTTRALAGNSDGLSPVIFMTGSPQEGSGPFPSLRQEISLQPRETRRLTWSQVALPSEEESFTQARRTAARPWEAEIAQIDLINAGQIEIFTGDSDWDFAFALTQKIANGLLMSSIGKTPADSFVLTRFPDQGFSLRGDGSDYNHLWNGQSPIDVSYLIGMILPNADRLAQGLLSNFLYPQAEGGFIDWKPGLAGQRGKLMATPILSNLAWRVYSSTEDKEFLAQCYPNLLAFFRAWFDAEHDRDQDGIPEWDHTLQAGCDDHPLFSNWQEWSQGVDISTAESPALCAFLYRESQSLLQIARLLNNNRETSNIESIADRLRAYFDESWNATGYSYSYRDRDTHLVFPGEKLGERSGPGLIQVSRTFAHPVRLLVRIRVKGETTVRPQIIVHGISASGHHRVERIAYDRFRWYRGFGAATGDRLYTALEHLDLDGLGSNDEISVYKIGYQFQDITTLLPLWAGIPSPEQAQILIDRLVLNPEIYWLPFGIPACPYPPDEGAAPLCHSVHMPWNSFIGEGLLKYGYREQAANLVSRLMTCVSQSLKNDGAFRRYYHAISGIGGGDQNILTGLAPIGLFLEVLGIRVISPFRLGLGGFNPFPAPITVKYRGLSILRQKEKTIVTFPDGQSVEVDDPSPQILSLE